MSTEPNIEKIAALHDAPPMHRHPPRRASAWMDQEMEWQKKRNLVTGIYPQGLPLKHDHSSLALIGDDGSTVTRTTVRLFNTHFNTNQARGREHPRDPATIVPEGFMEDMAILVHSYTSIPRIFQNLILNVFASKDVKQYGGLTIGAPRHWASTVGQKLASPFRATTQLWQAAEQASDAALGLKYVDPVHRPQAVITRMALSYPEGAPQSPSYPSIHAAQAGAAAAVLTGLNCGSQAIALAETLALARWGAGVSWMADLLEGLDLGWQVACTIGNLRLGESPWEERCTWSVVEPADGPAEEDH